MIRIPLSADKLKKLIDIESPTWLAKAKKKTKEAIAAGRVAGNDGIWSEIKDVYMELQGFKCMYCEKPMPKPDPRRDGATGKVEYDVEHFRPKNRVTAWPTDKVKLRRKIDYEKKLKTGYKSGYVWLAFDHLNYGVSCKTCNSELKGDKFPILGTVGNKGQSVAALDRAEKPCLLLPIGNTGTDPESLLSWRGPLVSPKKGLSPQDALRALVLIDFFELDTRRDLLDNRCQGIMLLFHELEKGSQKSDQFVKTFTNAQMEFAGCYRAFVALFRNDRKSARDWYEKCRQYVLTRGRVGLSADSPAKTRKRRSR